MIRCFSRSDRCLGISGSAPTSAQLRIFFEIEDQMAATKRPVRVRLRRSPVRAKKWRVEVLGTGAHVDFGQSGAEDFTIHKDPFRMVRYLTRHAANIPASLKAASRVRDDGARTTQRALRVVSSRRERWGDADLAAAVRSAGFWSRWLLWSLPDLEAAKRLVHTRFGIEFV